MIYWISAAGMGILGTALAYYLWNLGIFGIGAAQAGIFLNIAPLATGLFAFLFGEKILAYHLLSGTIIISGILIMQWKVKPQSSKV